MHINFIYYQDAHFVIHFLSNSEQLVIIYHYIYHYVAYICSTGKLPPDAIPGDLAKEECMLGMEFSGTDSKDRRVMGLLPARVRHCIYIYSKYKLNGPYSMILEIIMVNHKRVMSERKKKRTKITTCTGIWLTIYKYVMAVFFSNQHEFSAFLHVRLSRKKQIIIDYWWLLTG